MNYLGEWQTHPEDAPTPFRHDRTDGQRLVMTQLRIGVKEEDVLADGLRPFSTVLRRTFQCRA